MTCHVANIFKLVYYMLMLPMSDNLRSSLLIFRISNTMLLLRCWAETSLGKRNKYLGSENILSCRVSPISVSIYKGTFCISILFFVFHYITLQQ